LINVNAAEPLGQSYSSGSFTVRVALFADMHANREAFAACLRQAREDGAGQHIFLGDQVGYGADPEWVVEAVMEHVAGGGVAVLGNHDNAVADLNESLNVEAQVAMEWTRGELGRDQRRFLEALPLTYHDGALLYVHADASSPRSWRYVVGVEEAARSMMATSAEIIFCGHVHRPALYTMSATGKVTAFTPVADAPIQLLPRRRWLAVLGSVGQPRDGNPAAAYAILDTKRRELTYRRAPYDIDAAAAKIRAKGLPASLADRLSLGR
jgi:diadenosine tetraphosphatase ApaH/serine/threonine PP2A family protein phosphatase